MNLLLPKITVGLCVFLLLAATPSLGQDHAPTVAQCQADQRLWASDLYDGNVKEAVSKLSFQTLQIRVSEMGDCVFVDEERAQHYANLGGSYGLVMAKRLKNFVERHDLTAQFLAEDAAGKR